MVTKIYNNPEISIISYSDIWESHIVNRHPYVMLYKHEFENAIIHPTAVTMDAENKKLRFHYGPIGKDFFKIVMTTQIKDGKLRGKIISAYLTKHIDIREQKIN